MSDPGDKSVLLQSSSGKRIGIDGSLAEVGKKAILLPTLAKPIIARVTDLAVGDPVIVGKDSGGKNLVIPASTTTEETPEAVDVDPLKSLTAIIDPTNPARFIITWVPGDNNDECEIDINVDGGFPLKPRTGEDYATWPAPSPHQPYYQWWKSPMRFFAWHFISGWGKRDGKWSKVKRQAQVKLDLSAIFHYLKLYVTPKYPSGGLEFRLSGRYYGDGTQPDPLRLFPFSSTHYEGSWGTADISVVSPGVAYSDALFGVLVHLYATTNVYQVWYTHHYSYTEFFGGDIVGPTGVGWVYWHGGSANGITGPAFGVYSDGQWPIWGNFGWYWNGVYAPWGLGGTFSSAGSMSRVDAPAYIPFTWPTYNGDKSSYWVYGDGLNPPGQEFGSGVWRTTYYNGGGHGRADYTLYFQSRSPNANGGKSVVDAYMDVKLVDPDNGILEIWGWVQGDWNPLSMKWENKWNDLQLYFGDILLCDNITWQTGSTYHGFLGISLLMLD